MNAEQQLDIEIYVRDTDTQALCDWLEKRLGALTPEPSRGTMAKYIVEVHGHLMPVRITSHAVGKAWTCVWLDSPHTPWADDLACARDCFAVLGKEVRCATGPWSEQNADEPDTFICLTADGATTKAWKTS